jgi:hypothetical protein
MSVLKLAAAEDAKFFTVFIQRRTFEYLSCSAKVALVSD